MKGSERQVSEVLESFFLRLSQAKSLTDVNTAAGIAAEEIEEMDWAVEGQEGDPVFKAV